MSAKAIRLVPFSLTTILFSCLVPLTWTNVISGDEGFQHVLNATSEDMTINRNLRRGAILATHEERGFKGIDLNEPPLDETVSEVISKISGHFERQHSSKSINQPDEARPKRQRSSKHLDEGPSNRLKSPIEDVSIELLDALYKQAQKDPLELFKVLYRRSMEGNDSEQKKAKNLLDFLFMVLYRAKITSTQFRAPYPKDDALADRIANAYAEYHPKAFLNDQHNLQLSIKEYLANNAGKSSKRT